MSIRAAPAVEAPKLDMDFGSTMAMPTAAKPANDTVKFSVPDLALTGSSLSFSPEPAPPPPAPIVIASATPPAPVDSGMIEFDLGSLSLDLDSPPAPAAAAGAGASEPLETKLALAAEFNSIGDSDGARALAEEVLAEASGALKSKAQKFLSELS